MSYELKEGQGSLFKNRKKETDRHPDWTGEIKINGKIYWVSGWDKNSDKAGNWFSLAVKEKTFKDAAKAASAPSKYATDIDDSEIPF